MTPSRWIPLEANPDIFNEWSERVGLVLTQAHFEDVYGLDKELLDMVPQPVFAVVLLFPVRESIKSWREQEDSNFEKEGLPIVDPTIMWIKQTISNACGTMGLLHALANSNVVIQPESPLAKFIDECKDKTPKERSQLLESTSLFANVHAETASSGATAVPADLDTDLHFTCFIQAPVASDRTNQRATQDRRLIELDGDRPGPIDRGECTDLLKDAATYIKENVMPKAASLQFSMMALVA